MVFRVAKPMTLIATLILVIVVVTGAVAVYSSWSQSFQGCELLDPTESTKLALEQYSETIQQLLTLSTTLAALGAAVLLGFQKGLSLTKDRRILGLASTACFTLSAYFALLWKSGLGQILYIQCPKLLAGPAMQFSFDATANFFLAGLLLIGLVVLLAAFQGGDR